MQNMAYLEKKLSRMRNNTEIKKYKGSLGFGKEIDILVKNSIYSKGTVDAVLMEKQVKLNKETILFLYEKYTPLSVNYIKGSRPFLEKIVNTETKPCSNDIERCLRLSKWCRKIEDTFPMKQKSNSSGFYEKPAQFFWGGTEEEIIKKGSDWCNEVARVHCILCQIAGIPARLVYIYSKSGIHVCSEVFISKKWSFFDITSQKYYRIKDKIASIWEILQNPCIVDTRRRKTDLCYVDSKWFLHAGIVNYFANNFYKYNYGWDLCNKFYENKLKKIWNKG